MGVRFYILFVGADSVKPDQVGFNQASISMMGMIAGLILKCVSVSLKYTLVPKPLELSLKFVRKACVSKNSTLCCCMLCFKVIWGVMIIQGCHEFIEFSQCVMPKAKDVIQIS